MKVPLSWLRDFAPFGDDVDELAGSLSGLGLVVEGLERVGEGLEGVVVARVVATAVHPDADKVQLVEVDTGDGATSQIVCGAFNFGPGDLVPLATIGARLPNGMEIGRRKVRGQWSEGMLCSPTELGLADDHSGIMVVEAAGAEPGMALADALGIRPDAVFDLDITPNRPDALSVAGVARDLAAHHRLPFAIPEPSPLAADDGRAQATVVVEAVDLSARFTGTVISGVTVGPSPAWLAGRLTMAGMRPISNVVDVSNHVMLELGQPNHAYDLDRLPGRGLLVRRGRPGETLVTLDEVTRPVGPDDCLICDAEGTPVGVGGIMGGASSEISRATTTVFLESAWFRPEAIARTSKRLGLRSEASVRFERGVDPEGVHRAAARFRDLLTGITGAEVVGGIVDATDPDHLPRRVTVPVRTARVNAILGTDLSSDQVRDYLFPIGFTSDPAPAATGTFDVTIPTWRPDSEREIDVVEEVARHHGYSRIERTRPPVATVGRLDAHQRDRRLVADILVGAGLSEAWAMSFLAPDDLARAGLPTEAIELENPLAAEESILRPSLLPGLLKALVTNTAHRRPHVSLFEIGHVFLPPAPGDRLPPEPEHLAVVLAGRDATDAVRTWRALAEGLRLAPVRLRATSPPGLHPTRTAELVAGDPAVGELVVGTVGEVDPGVLATHQLDGPVGWIQADLGLLLDDAPRRPSTYRPISRYPSADIDLALVVDDAVPAGDVERTLRTAAGDLLEDVALFDVYRGDGVGAGGRSLAYHLRFSALDHTLTEDELAGVRRRCIEAVESQCGGRLRG
ncbi:MAG TPA: phenylalanine--tRNA ligase subunit beta [Acidimicrobiales bacterium]|nr:phenylalanine--tRNA ligase subunit beta [Acidimicrobiales bacterium]